MLFPCNSLVELGKDRKEKLSLFLGLCDVVIELNLKVFDCGVHEINKFHPLTLFNQLFAHHWRFVISCWPDMSVSE